MSAPPADAAPDGPEAEGDGQPQLLVSEFPPPPYYYGLAAEGKLKPPPIPNEALARGTRKAAAAGAKARAEAERLRLNDTGAILGGVDDKEEEGEVVAVFGEIVEDPFLVEPLDHCEEPKVIAETVKKYAQNSLASKRSSCTLCLSHPPCILYLQVESPSSGGFCKFGSRLGS